MSVKDKYRHQRRYADNQVEDGLVRMTMWVPSDDRSEAMAHSKKLRAAHYAKVEAEAKQTRGGAKKKKPAPLNTGDK